jgi:hypothetical protein
VAKNKAVVDEGRQVLNLLPFSVVIHKEECKEKANDKSDRQSILG